jgi:uncharacterized membrane protein YciS (DUF1049 family)
MLRKLISALILVPLATVLVSLAVANRQVVQVSFDPFDQAHPAYAVSTPLFALILALLICGVIIGGVAAWLRQAKWRTRARRLEAEVRTLRQENERLQRRVGAAEATPSVPALPVVDAPRLTIPPPG